jgi:hypothetical protein
MVIFFWGFITAHLFRNCLACLVVPENGSQRLCFCSSALPKPRPVPDTERNKDTNTLDYASPPLDANTLLAAVSTSSQPCVRCL